MSKSWFYLTLWHGTPPEFTSEFDVEISDTSPVDAMIRRADDMDTELNTTASLSADIRSRETIGTELIKTTEVVWYVS